MFCKNGFAKYACTPICPSIQIPDIISPKRELSKFLFDLFGTEVFAGTELLNLFRIGRDHRIDGGLWSEPRFGGAVDVKAVAGVHRVEIAAVDHAGNIDPTPLALKVGSLVVHAIDVLGSDNVTKRALAEASELLEQAIEAESDIVVGVNGFTVDEDESIEMLKIDPEGERGIRTFVESKKRPGERLGVDEYYGWIGIELERREDGRAVRFVVDPEPSPEERALRDAWVSNP